MQKVLSGFVQVLFLELLFQAFVVQTTLCLFIAEAVVKTEHAACPLPSGVGA